MIAAAFLVLVQAVAPDVPLPPAGETVAVPSGQEVQFVEVVRDAAGAEGLTYRFRFLAPGIGPGGGVAFETAVDDMQALCDLFAVPRLAAIGPVPRQVVISLADRPVAFGEPAPEAVQFFEAYAVDGGVCIWEEF